MSSEPDRGRAPRGDAQRNRRALLEAAGRLVAARGSAVPLDDIAREAGVGSGTLYRNFAARTELFVALYDELVDRIDALVEAALAEPTGWGAIVAYVDGVIGIADACPHMVEVVAYVREHRPGYREGDQWIAPTMQALERAQREGSVRSDLAATDLSFLPHLLVPLVRLPAPQRGLMMARMRALLLDGIRERDSERTDLPLRGLRVEELRSLSRPRGSWSREDAPR